MLFLNLTEALPEVNVCNKREEICAMDIVQASIFINGTFY